MTTAPERKRLMLGGLDLAVIDPHERDTAYIFDEIFTEAIYDHPRFDLAPGATIVDVGANIGLYTIWAARRYRPATILAFEASPTTYGYLLENVARHVDPAVTRVETVNRAVSDVEGRMLELHQAPFTSGISTVLDEKSVPWVDTLRRSGELVTHTVATTTLSREIGARGLERVDLLKIDVEGHFLAVLDGITPRDMAKVRRIALEADYLEALKLREDDVHVLLRKKGFATETRGHQTIYAWRQD